MKPHMIPLYVLIAFVYQGAELRDTVVVENLSLSSCLNMIQRTSAQNELVGLTLMGARCMPANDAGEAEWTARAKAIGEILKGEPKWHFSPQRQRDCLHTPVRTSARSPVRRRHHYLPHRRIQEGESAHSTGGVASHIGGLEVSDHDGVVMSLSVRG